MTSYFEWIGAGVYRVDERSGSMHGKKFVIHEVLFGSDGRPFVRADFHPGYKTTDAMEARLTLQPLNDDASRHVTVSFPRRGRRGDARSSGGSGMGRVSKYEFR